MTKNNNLLMNSQFWIPDLKVGILDIIVSLSDEVIKQEALWQGMVKKVTQFMADVLEDSKDRMLENQLPNEVDLVM